MTWYPCYRNVCIVWVSVYNKQVQQGLITGQKPRPKGCCKPPHQSWCSSVNKVWVVLHGSQTNLPVLHEWAAVDLQSRCVKELSSWFSFSSAKLPTTARTVSIHCVTTAKLITDMKLQHPPNLQLVQTLSQTCHTAITNSSPKPTSGASDTNTLA